MKKTFVRWMALSIIAGFAGASNAGPIYFSFDGDAADWPWISRSFAPGTTTGILYGLADDGVGLFPTSIDFTSDVSALGMTQTTGITFGSSGGSGFTLVGGEVTAASFISNFNDPIVGGLQIRFNSEARNVLHWNGGSGPFVGYGNADGFAGATFSSVPPDNVPTPATLALFGLGLAGLGWSRRKKA